jgi:hypothetical protein
MESTPGHIVFCKLVLIFQILLLQTPYNETIIFCDEEQEKTPSLLYSSPEPNLRVLQ